MPNYYEDYMREKGKREELENDNSELRKRCEDLEGEIKKLGGWDKL